MHTASVAIDGPVASGKSTAARAVAQRLGSAYVDTGAMYRAAALGVLRNAIDPSSEAAIVAFLQSSPVTLEPDDAAPLGYRVRCGEAEAGTELFDEAVSTVVSIVAAHPRVRSAMVEEQRRLASRLPVVMAGRDIGTIVLPDAGCKVFLTASVDARVARRAAELSSLGVPFEHETLRAQIEERDRLDSTRPVGSLRPADGAVVIDSSDLSAADVVDRIVALARSNRSAP